LQHGQALDELLIGLKNEQKLLQIQFAKYVPILVKIAPDLTDQEIVDMSNSLINAEIDGVIATNTTLDRSEVLGQQYADEMGGLSGAVLAAKSQAVTEKLVEVIAGRLTVIGVGGIHSSASAKARIDAGSTLIQLYTSLIYQGPKVIKEIVNAI
jgi:dihydroorotate dehydrogenase